MLFAHLQSLLRQFRTSRSARQRRVVAVRPRLRPFLETLEDRCVPSLSQLVEADWLTAGDNAITQDTRTSLEWLDVPQSAGLSYNDVSGQLGSGGQFEGFRYATANEVLSLWRTAEIPDLNTDATVANIAPSQALISFVGATMSQWGYAGTLGFTGDSAGGGSHYRGDLYVYSSYALVGEASTIRAAQGDTYGTGSVGSWLVRGVATVDVISPTISAPANISTLADVGQSTATVDVGTATATDDSGAAPALTGVRADGLALADPYPIGETRITWTATDAEGNAARVDQMVIVFENVPPTIVAPSDIVVQATSVTGAVVNYLATATDNAGTPIEVIGDPASGSLFPIGTTTVILTATDSNGNFATISFTITVESPSPVVLLDATSAEVNNTSLSKSQKAGLIRVLEDAKDLVAKDQSTRASRKLDHFISTVQRYQKSGALDAATAADLIAQVMDIQALLGV